MKYGAFDTFLRTAAIICIILFGILSVIEGISRITSSGEPLPGPKQNIKITASVPAGIVPYEWKAIIIHHSTTEDETLASMKKRFSEMGFTDIPYHFVIQPNGTIAPLSAWKDQENIQQTMDEYFNRISIGICVVGNFNLLDSEPTSLQMSSLTRLIKHLMTEYGIKGVNVHKCGDVDEIKSSPGRNFPWRKLLYSIK
jgi:N-acetyl-anhydromuramyl-L-alanine amidase AmpD